MRMLKAARMADTVLATDAYGTATIYCQLAPLDLFKVDGVAVRKRQMSAADEAAIPARGVITIVNEQYLVGTGTPDFYRGQVIRRNYVIQGADGLANLHSISGALNSTAPVQAYVAKVFAKYLPDEANSSKYPPQYQIFLAGSENAPEDSLIELSSEWFLIKESYVSTSGLRIALANRLDAPIFETVTFGDRAYNPVTDAYTSSTSSIKILRVKWTEHYTYLSIGTEKYQSGDEQVFMLKSVTPVAPDTLTLSDGAWRILAVQDETTHWSCHVRRA